MGGVHLGTYTHHGTMERIHSDGHLGHTHLIDGLHSDTTDGDIILGVILIGTIGGCIQLDTMIGIGEIE